jgi:hypothetical protein
MFVISNSQKVCHGRERERAKVKIIMKLFFIALIYNALKTIKKKKKI